MGLIHNQLLNTMKYSITLPPFAPNAVKRHLIGTAAAVYSMLNQYHNWLMDAINKGIYPEFIELDAEGMVTGYTINKDYREPALAMIRRETVNVARDYHKLLIRESEQLAMSDYIASIDSIQL